MSIFPQAWIQVLARKCGIPFLDVVSPRVPGTPNRRPQRPGEINAGSTFCGAQVYFCSIRTMYRILEQEHELRERRNQLRHPNYQKPELLATAPNQVWVLG